MAGKLPQVRLAHILSEIDALLAATDGLSMREILGDYRNLRMVERALQIVSEAARELPQEWRDASPEIAWPQITAFGNRLRHEYYKIDHRILSNILSIELPRMRPVVARLIAEAASGDPPSPL
jgi:uncharacterized protein with HEPN domain